VPPSGVVNLVTKRAGATPVTSVTTSVNQHGGADAHVDIGRRFHEGDMGLRVNAAAGKVDIGIDNFSGDRSMLALAYDWRVTPGFNLKADLEHYRKDVSEQAAIALLPPVGGTINLPPVPDNKRNLAGEWQHYDAKATNALLRGDLALGDAWSLTMETGHAETGRDRRLGQFKNYNLATGEGQLDISFVDGQRFTNTNHRVEVLGQLGSGAVRHELTLGYTTNRRTAYSGASAANMQVPQNLYNPRPVPELNPAMRPGANSAIRDKGIYVFDRVSFGDRWQLQAGLRASDYSNQQNVNSRYSASDVSPNVSVLFKPTPDTSVYASYLEGLEETATAPTSRANSGEILPPAVAKQKELGIKSRAWRGVFAQAALFQIDRAQTTVDGANRLVLGGESRYRGLELSASGDITPSFGMVASMLLLDAEIASVGTVNRGELGKTPENTPKRTASLFGEYRLPQVPGLSLNAGLFHIGKRAVNNLNQAWIGSYTTLSLGARYRTKLAGRNVTLQANLDNAADRDYWATAGNGLLGTGAPRTLRLAAKFDL
jgi:iron complex outermembrane receptor protein